MDASNNSVKKDAGLKGDSQSLDGEATKSDATSMEEGQEDALPSSIHNSVTCFKDESTECAICLGSLDDPDMEVVQLTTCGHRWHLECLKEQLSQAQPNPAQRLVLTGCRCAKCGSVCDHPSLRHMTRKTDALQKQVDSVLKEQLDDNQQNDAEALEEARRNYAIYLCSHCHEPYFGGTIACADTIDGEVPPEERLCVACAPTRLQQVHCRHPLEHRGHHIWKCRYCCQSATHVCYGTVHFCQACHDRNSKRVALVKQQQQQQKLHQRRGGHISTTSNNIQNDIKPPSGLSSIPCPGGDECSFPKPKGETQHKNGPTAECEQVYGCAWCESNPDGTSHHTFNEPPGSHNLLQNASGQEGPPRLPIWQPMRGQWKREHSDPPLSDTITTNFVSNHSWCIMAQLIDLRPWVRDPSQVRIEVSAKYMGRTDCPSIFRMQAMLLADQQRVIARQDTGVLSAPADFWERVSLVFEPTQEAQTVVLVVHGKDRNFWAGNFGSKVTDCKVRVLGEPGELEAVLLPGVVQEPTQAAVQGDNGMATNHRAAGTQQQLRAATAPQPRGRHEQWWRTVAMEAVLPVLCLVLLGWLLQ